MGISWKKAFIPLMVSAGMLLASPTLLALDSVSWTRDADMRPLSAVSTLAGSGLYGDETGAAATAQFRSPAGIAVLPDGSVLVADTENQVIKSVKNGTVSEYAGITFDIDAYGMPVGGLVDGVLAESAFQLPSDIEADAAGNLYVADTGNNVIRKIGASGNVAVFAGDPVGAPGDADGSGSAAKFNHPSDIAVASSGVVYVADTLNHTIRKISTDGTVTTLNARPVRSVEVFPGVVEPAGDFRDGALEQALFNEPSGLALDRRGNLYVSDTGNQRIRYIDFSVGTVVTVAGGLEVQYPEAALYAKGDYIDGPAQDAAFHSPKGLAVTEEGGLLIADSRNHAVRYLHDGRVVTLIGDGVNGRPGTADGPETRAGLHSPSDVAIDAHGNVLVADTFNNKIRQTAFYRLPAGLAMDGDIHVVYGGAEIGFDVKPRNVNNRVMVPVRAIAETLGYTVETGDNVHIALTQGEMTIRLTVGGTNVSRSAGNGEEETTIDVAPFIGDDYTFVPVRFLSEQLGLQVDWNPAYKTVIIR